MSDKESPWTAVAVSALYGAMASLAMFLGDVPPLAFLGCAFICGHEAREAVLRFARRRAPVVPPLGTAGVMVGFLHAVNDDGSATYVFPLGGIASFIDVRPRPFPKAEYGDVIVFNGRAAVLMRAAEPAKLIGGAASIPTAGLRVVDARLMPINADRDFVQEHREDGHPTRPR